MITLLLVAQLTCAEVNWLLDGIEKAEISVKDKAELKLHFLQYKPDDCERENVRR